ncbi:hypothetical protein Sjap_013205 [Stephania japonica]|uniref:Uncharacterized protein n=1 Tax=Stephania japonica TaxID=461633 RepID=A0AAP0IZ95_9MAGN
MESLFPSKFSPPLHTPHHIKPCYPVFSTIPSPLPRHPVSSSPSPSPSPSSSSPSSSSPSSSSWSPQHRSITPLLCGFEGITSGGPSSGRSTGEKIGEVDGEGAVWDMGGCGLLAMWAGTENPIVDLSGGIGVGLAGKGFTNESFLLMCLFHPTDEELITHYLSKKVSDDNFNARAIGEIIKMTDRRSGSGSGRGPPSDIGQGSCVQTSIGRGRGRGRFQSMQHQPRQEDHIPPAPPERELTLSRPPTPLVIRRLVIRPVPFEPPSRPASRPRLIEGRLDPQRDALSPPTEQLISTGLAELASMTRQSQNSTPSSSAHHSTPASYAGGTSAGATHDSPSSSTHPSTSSSAPRQLPHVEMPHDPASPPELTGDRDEPRIRITVKNKSLHPSDVCARKMTDTFKKDMIPEGCRWKYIPQYQRDIYWETWKLLSKGERPIYVTEEAWRRYVEYWESDDFKARSKIASSNRQTEKGGPGTGVSKHTSGSIPFLVHEERLSKKLGRDCTSLELYLHVHTKKHDGQTFIDARSERVNAEIQRMREEMSQSAEEAGDDPHVDETDLYYKVVGVDHKGRVYGLGSTGRRYNDPVATHLGARRARDFATLQSNSMRGGHPGASSSHPPPPPPPPPLRPRLRPPPPPRPSHQETLTPPTAVPAPALDSNDVYRPRMYEPEDEEEMNLPLQQEWIDALSDTHPLPQPDRDN